MNKWIKNKLLEVQEKKVMFGVSYTKLKLLDV